jgi:pyruvate formate lyase activating enzyme
VREYRVEEMINLIKQNQSFLSGITVSGGESSLQLPFILSLFKAIKTTPSLKHLSCFIDSNGSLSENGWNKLNPYLDGAMIDLKAWDGFIHEKLVGRDNRAVLNSIKHLAKLDKLYEVRLLPIPNQTDYTENMPQLIAFLASLPASVDIRLNAFQHHGVVGDALLWERYSKQDLELLKQQLQAKLPHSVITR